MDNKENVGSMNVGSMNAGNRNVGDWNVGNMNVGDWNVGSMNVGDWNVGSMNVGSMNVGDWNVGRFNVGRFNVGSMNVGSMNVGSMNVGDWNVGDRNVGFFNTTTPSKVNVFDVLTEKSLFDECDKPSFIYFDLTKWIYSNDMTGEEKEANEMHGNTGGYLKKLDYKEEFQRSYKEASEEDKKKIFNIPNFDADKFLEISGIDVRVDSEKETKKAELIAKAEELLEQARLM